ncbi:acetyl-CoA carboxylase biotin carboxylase subunit [Candidatus Sumerlaeota bacterium]|nr:acetyl-CoA carboxylase biotin carboxylase subunit [Candidatus Sumerlaeota bacterium]
MFRKVLVANRGEIALRVIRACRELGIQTVAVYSEADKYSLHVHAADEALCIGPAPGSQSYLNVARIISAAEVTGADAIHPGYGFLAENARFAEICADCNITFIGPSAEAIRKMGDKNVAKKTAKDAGCPTVPGSDGALENAEQGMALAAKIGYPVMIKASAGGGGKGMRMVSEERLFKASFETAAAEAQSAFSNPEVYLEKCIIRPKHVEIQVLGDRHGNIIHLGERDCSVQRRHQKLIEEAPCPVLTRELREKMGEAAIRAARAVNYVGAGTIEFLLDKDRNFYFMEMNTRVQVEHPITEEITGIDIVREQILVAAGKKLSRTQDQVTWHGHSIECRINAEDPAKNFIPSPGKIVAYVPPGGIGVRIDSAAYQDYVIPPFYDSMIAKLIVHADTRDEAIARMKRALREFVVDGVKSTIPFHLEVMDSSLFKRGTFGTDFLEVWKKEADNGSAKKVAPR